MTELDERRRQLKDDIVRERGYWHPFHEGLLKLDPDFLAAYLAFVGGPWKSGALAPKVREFIYIAVDASAAHLYERGMRRHIEFALAKGATAREIIEVLELTTALGCRTSAMGVRVLAEERAALGLDDADATAELSDEQRSLKNEFIARMGYWPSYCDALLRFDAEHLRASLAFLSAPWASGALEPKIKELISVAVNAAPTTLHEDGVRFHMRRALRHGATVGEIMETLQLASAIAIHTCTIGVPALMECIEPKKEK